MRNLRDYAVITGTYWVFTLTDGALRMLVLLHLHVIGCSPLEIASLFLFYEFFGIVTNLIGGWVGARHGLKATLVSGVSLQIVACSLLAAAASDLTIPIVLAAQAMSGTAKDLTKMSAKSYVKLVVPEGDQRGLLRWVALLTGSKNTLKGVGFFLGGLLLAAIGFRAACIGMAAALALTLLVASIRLPGAAGRSSRTIRITDLVSHDARINWLSAARLFLFGARDIWFVLALPIFLSSSLGWTHARVGGFLALWVIGYGIVQALAPAYVGGRGHHVGHGPGSGSSSGSSHRAPDARWLWLWTAALVLPLGGIGAALSAGAAPVPTLVIGLVAFAVIFATDSVMHSYLIVDYADGDSIALRVGFYYMANASGRLVGTALSGALFQVAGQGADGLLLCIGGSAVFVLISSALCLPLRRTEPSPAGRNSGVIG